MKIIGQVYQNVAPVGFLVGPKGKNPITSFYGVNTVGSIPTCSVGVPLEILDQIPDEQTDDIYYVTIGPSDSEQYVMFSGYICGDNSRVTSKSLNCGLNLVHGLARDMDQHRISAPDLHPQSVGDFTYEFKNFSTLGTNCPFNFSNNSYYDSSKEGKMAAQIINGLIKNIKDVQSKRVGAGASGAKEETAAAAVAALQQVAVLNSQILPEISGVLSNQNTNSINGVVQIMAESSFTDKRSAWDTLVAIFSQFGLHLICDNTGDVYISADMAGFKPAPGNVLDGNYVINHDKTSLFQRNIKEVNIIGHSVALGRSTGTGNSQLEAGTIVTWPIPGTSTDVGASMAILLPGWLNPLATAFQETETIINEPPSAGNPNNSNQFSATPVSSDPLYTAQLQYARMIYLLERNKLRTMTLSGPLAPQAYPGTTALLQPFSALHAKSGGGSSLQKSYAGYCYQIVNMMSVEEKNLQTTFFFRNVGDAASTQLVETHPIFSDVKPFTWP